MEETEAQRCGKACKVTQLASGRARMWTGNLSICLQRPSAKSPCIASVDTQPLTEPMNLHPCCSLRHAVLVQMEKPKFSTWMPLPKFHCRVLWPRTWDFLLGKASRVQVKRHCLRTCSTCEASPHGLKDSVNFSLSPQHNPIGSKEMKLIQCDDPLKKINSNTT